MIVLDFSLVIIVGSRFTWNVSFCTALAGRAPKFLCLA
jgi:hypothetical protein